MWNKQKYGLLMVSLGLLGLMLAPWGQLAPAPARAVGEAHLEAEEFESKQANFLEAAKLRRLQLQDENGNIAPDGLLKAQAHIREMAAAQVARAAPLGLSPEAGGLAPGAWQWRGPGNIGGRIRSIVINPDNPQQIWVGSVSGGIWTTTNGGTSWAPVNDFLANLNVSTMVMNPVAHNVLYAGTGEGFGNIDALRGPGVFKSADTGANWSPLPGTQTWYNVNRLDVSPDGTVILAATSDNMYRSTDSGANWATVLTTTNVLDVNFAPSNGSQAIASGTDGRAWYSQNGGVSWAAANVLTATGRIEVAYVPGNADIVYASVNINNGELWKSTDGGQSYAPVNTGNSLLGGQGWYDNIVWVDPTNASVVIVGGVELRRSMDGGVSMTNINGIHTDHHMIVAHPNFDGSTNKTVFFGGDGGIYKTNNVYTATTDPADWQALNNNLGITQFYGGSVGPTGRLSGGTQDNGDLTDNFTQNAWTEFYGGDGGFSASDPTDPNYIYGEYINLKIHRNTTGGGPSTFDIYGCDFWNGSDYVCKAPGYRIEDAKNNQANFIAPFILDPNNPNRRIFPPSWGRRKLKERLNFEA